MLTNDTAAKLAEFRTVRDTFATKLVAKLKDAGFTVTSVMPQTDWNSGLITVKSDKNKEFNREYSLEITASGYSRNTPDKLRLNWRTGGYRGSKARYTKLDDALIAKLVEEAKEGLQNAIESEERRVQSENLEAKYAEVRKQELAGLIVPPATEIKISASQNDRYVGKYYVKFDGSNSIEGKALTAEQVRKLMAVVNEIFNTQDGYAIVAKHGRTDEEIVYSQYGFYSNDRQARFFATREEAESQVEWAKRDASLMADTVRIVPYASVATI